MSRTKLLILIAALLISSGYRFRCYFLCTDQTAVQHDYVEERDRCRDYAEAKVDMTMNNLKKNPNDEKARKGQLVALFSECMANHGWSVPDGRDKSIAAGATGGSSTGKDNTISSAAANATARDAATAGIITSNNAGAAGAGDAALAGGAVAGGGMSAGEAATAAGLERAYLARKAECDFARHSASSSSIANARAQACDIECAQRLKNAPDAPRPAACPAEFNPNLSKGVERE